LPANYLNAFLAFDLMQNHLRIACAGLALAIPLLIVGCGGGSQADEKISQVGSPTRAIANSTANDADKWKTPPAATSDSDPDDRRRVEAQNEKFREVPDEFRSVDFKNFRFKNTSTGPRHPAFIPLKNGEYEYIDKKHTGGSDYSLGYVFFLNVAGDSKKEAIVFLDSDTCGGSCSGSGSTIYFFAAANPKPVQLAVIDTGCPSCGCDLKSFSIANKEIRIEQFGCNVKQDDLSGPICKFCVEDVKVNTYQFKGKKLRKISSQSIDTGVVDVMNYYAEISISD
jgi:hypothetical protein